MKIKHKDYLDYAMSCHNDLDNEQTKPTVENTEIGFSTTWLEHECEDYRDYEDYEDKKVK